MTFALDFMTIFTACTFWVLLCILFSRSIFCFWGKEKFLQRKKNCRQNAVNYMPQRSRKTILHPKQKIMMHLSKQHSGPKILKSKFFKTWHSKLSIELQFSIRILRISTFAILSQNLQFFNLQLQFKMRPLCPMRVFYQFWVCPTACKVGHLVFPSPQF